MLGFVAPRLVLLSVPKTGTTAIEEALAPMAQIVLRARPEIKHLTMRQYHHSIAPLVRTIPGPPFRVVAVMREPLSWLGSWYRYRQRPQLAGRPNSTQGLSFERFIADYLADDPRPRHAALGRQSGFLAPPPGQPGPDLMFRYEDMDRVVDFFQDALNIRLELPRRNVSPPGDLSLSAATERRLRSALAQDYALWESAAGGTP